MLWAIASKKNIINLLSAAFDTGFGRNLVHAYKFRMLLVEMVNASKSKVNSFTAEGKDEAKNFIDSAMQKMFEFEKLGVVIEADVKFYVLFQKAQFFLAF